VREGLGRIPPRKTRSRKSSLAAGCMGSVLDRMTQKTPSPVEARGSLLIYLRIDRYPLIAELLIKGRLTRHSFSSPDTSRAIRLVKVARRSVRLETQFVVVSSISNGVFPYDRSHCSEYICSSRSSFV
jgi:hypothetical protein